MERDAEWMISNPLCLSRLGRYKAEAMAEIILRLQDEVKEDKSGDL